MELFSIHPHTNPNDKFCLSTAERRSRLARFREFAEKLLGIGVGVNIKRSRDSNRWFWCIGRNQVVKIPNPNPNVK